MAGSARCSACTKMASEQTTLRARIQASTTTISSFDHRHTSFTILPLSAHFPHDLGKRCVEPCNLMLRSPWEVRRPMKFYVLTVDLPPLTEDRERENNDTRMIRGTNKFSEC